MFNSPYGKQPSLGCFPRQLHSEKSVSESVVSCVCETRYCSVCADINRVQLLGRVGRDPEQRGEAHPIIMFPLATQHTLRNTQPSEDDGTYT